MKFHPTNQFAKEQGTASKRMVTPAELGQLIRNPQSAIRNFAAFTLIELLVVIVIIALLATLGLPAIRGMTKSNAMAAANRQLLDDIAYARRLAIANHTTVYMVFVPPTITTFRFTKGGTTNEMTALTNLYGGQYTTYAMLSLRTVGDQPGTAIPQYYTPWRSLPNGVFIATNKFGLYDPTVTSDYLRAFPNSLLPISSPYAKMLPFPLASSTPVGTLPYIAFNYLGQLVSANNESEAIPLARGSILYARDENGALLPQPADVLETPAGNSITMSNVIHIDWLTGKARVERQEVQ